MNKEPIIWKNLTIRIPETLHKEFKVLALENDDVMKDILVERINQYIGEKKTPVVY